MQRALVTDDIGENAVLFSKNLTTLIQFPAGKDATSYAISQGVTNILQDAFFGSRLTALILPSSLANIGEFAFDDMSDLTNVLMPNGVTTIGMGAFFQCRNLINVAIPMTVTNIYDGASVEEGAFADCERLSSVTVDSNNPAYSSFNGVLFDRSRTVLVEFPGGVGGTYTIPEGVTSIGGDAFQECYYLTNVTIPNSVTCIGRGAFYLW